MWFPISADLTKVGAAQTLPVCSMKELAPIILGETAVTSPTEDISNSGLQEDTCATLSMRSYVNLLNLVYLYQKTNMFSLIYCNICNFITCLPFLLNNLGKVGAISEYCCSLFKFNLCKTINFTMFDRP